MKTNKYQLSDKIQIFIICFSVGLIIFLYGIYRCNNKKFTDPLIKGKNICRVCDLWSISHFVFNFILGYIYPAQGYFIFGLGLFWEGLEYLIQHEYFNNFPIIKYIINMSKCKNTHILSDKKQHWVYYEITDIPMNIAGLLSGIYFSKKYRK